MGGLWEEYMELVVSEILEQKPGATLRDVCLSFGLVVQEGETDDEATLDLREGTLVVDSRLSTPERDHAIATALGHAVLHKAELTAGVTLGPLHAEEAESFATCLLARLGERMAQ